MLALHLGLQAFLGKNDYDDLFADHTPLFIGATIGQAPFFRPIAMKEFNARDEKTGVKASLRRDLIPGDFRYFDAPNSKDPSLKHEFTIYLGHDEYFAHPWGVISKADLIKNLNEASHPKSGAHDSGYSFRPNRTPDLSQKYEPVDD
jgi:hypothetical protein